MSDAADVVSTIALTGNPNAGKTTLFNALTGSNQRVGNYAGVTVEVKSGETYTPHGRSLGLGCSKSEVPSDSRAPPGGDVHHQALPRLDHAARRELVPTEQVGEAEAELAGDARQGVAAAHDG